MTDFQDLLFVMTDALSIWNEFDVLGRSSLAMTRGVPTVLDTQSRPL